MLCSTVKSPLELMLSTEWNIPMKLNAATKDPFQPTFHPNPILMCIRAREITGGFIAKRKTSILVNDSKITACVYQLTIMG